MARLSCEVTILVDSKFKLNTSRVVTTGGFLAGMHADECIPAFTPAFTTDRKYSGDVYGASTSVLLFM
jgi:hypothetical protein